MTAGRHAILAAGMLLCLLMAVVQLNQPLMAAGFMRTLGVFDGRVVLLMTPFLLAAAAAIVGAVTAVVFWRGRRFQPAAVALAVGVLAPIPLSLLLHRAAMVFLAS